MRKLLGITAVAAAVGIGFAAGRVKPAQAVADEHANHDMSTMPTVGIVQQAPGIPASAAGAVERIQKSPRHAE